MIFTSFRDGSAGLFRRAADGTGAVERLTESPFGPTSSAITPDGTQIVYREGAVAEADIMRMPLEPPGNPEPLVQTMFGESNGVLPPAGQWLAYQSNESGRWEIYVRPFPKVEAGRWQVSTDGGTRPVWSRDGEELFYVSADQVLMGVRVEPGPSWRSSTPRRILEGQYFWGANPVAPVFDIAPDGQRFLMIKPVGETGGAQGVIVVENWFTELERLVPTN